MSNKWKSRQLEDISISRLDNNWNHAVDQAGTDVALQSHVPHAIQSSPFILVFRFRWILKVFLSHSSSIQNVVSGSVRVCSGTETEVRIRYGYSYSYI